MIAGSWNSYTPIGNPLYRATTTPYDALGRVLRYVKQIQALVSNAIRAVVYLITESYDANQHKRTLDKRCAGSFAHSD